MTQINTNTGIVKSIKNGRVVIALPRGGIVTTKTKEKFKPGESICFTTDKGTGQIVDTIQKSEADEIVRVNDEDIWPGPLDVGFELNDDEEFEVDEEALDLIIDEDEQEVIHELANQRQTDAGSPNSECGSDRGDVIDQADYYGDSPED